MRYPPFVRSSLSTPRQLERMKPPEMEERCYQLMKKAWESVGKRPTFGLQYRISLAPLPEDKEKRIEAYKVGAKVVITNMVGGLIEN